MWTRTLRHISSGSAVCSFPDVMLSDQFPGEVEVVESNVTASRRSHTGITHDVRSLLCMNHICTFHMESIYWRERRRDTLLNLRLPVPHFLICHRYVFFCFQRWIKMEGGDDQRMAGCFLCACRSCSHFSTKWKANCSEVDARKQNKGWWDGV